MPKDPNILEAHNKELLEQERQALRPWGWLGRSFFLVGVFLLTTVIAAQAILIVPPSLAPRPVMKLQSSIAAIFPFSLLPRVGSTLLNGEVDDRVNVLVTGIGGPGHDGPYLTDTILLASYKPSTNTVALLSIPRDLLVPPPPPGGRKINSIGTPEEVATPGAGAVALQKEVERLFGLDIPYYLRVDFTGFEQLVDRIGGVDVVVDRSFEDTHYPIIGREDAPNFSDRYETITFTVGPQHFDGATALKFARSRYGNNGEGSDFSRMRRQHIVIAALKEKLLSPSLFRPRSIVALSSLLQNHVTTNIGFMDVFRMQEILNSNPRILAESLDLGSGVLEETRGFDGAYLLQPKQGNYGMLKDVASDLFTTGRVVSNLPPVHAAVFNATPVTGLAALASDALRKAGVAVTNIGNAPEGVAASRTTIYDFGSNAHRKERDELAAIFGAAVEHEAPAWVEERETNILVPAAHANEKPDFVIVLGGDAARRLNADRAQQ